MMETRGSSLIDVVELNPDDGGGPGEVFITQRSISGIASSERLSPPPPTHGLVPAGPRACSI